MIEVYIRAVRQRFSELEQREKYAVLGLSVFLALFFFVAVICKPIYEYREDQRKRFEKNLELYTYLKSTETEARNISKTSGPQRNSGQALLTKVSRTAQNSGIKPSRMQPEGDDGVSIWFDSVSFDKFDLLLQFE